MAPLSRAEFERHEVDEYAHTQARHRERAELTVWQLGMETRMRRTERQLAALGALAGVAAAVAGAALGVLLQRLF